MKNREACSEQKQTIKVVDLAFMFSLSNSCKTNFYFEIFRLAVIDFDWLLQFQLIFSFAATKLIFLSNFQ